MRLILDTHILLWTLADSRALPKAANDLLLDPAHDKIASVVSLWEIAIKHHLRRGHASDIPFDAGTALALIGEAGLELLAIAPAHAVAVDAIAPQRRADPFDRMLVAQSLAEPAYLLTSDAALQVYGNSVLLV